MSHSTEGRIPSHFLIERPSLAFRKMLERRIFKPAPATAAVSRMEVVA